MGNGVAGEMILTVSFVSSLKSNITLFVSCAKILVYLIIRGGYISSLQ